jgi:hypothetical protein
MEEVQSLFSFFSMLEELKTNTRLQNLVKRMQEAANVTEENPNTHFNWVVSIAPRGTEVLRHVDPLYDERIKTKKILRINLLVQNAKRGGAFQIYPNNKDDFIDVEIPDRALMMFYASEIDHRITMNLSDTTRINLSIDALIDR